MTPEFKTRPVHFTSNSAALTPSSLCYLLVFQLSILNQDRNLIYLVHFFKSGYIGAWIVKWSTSHPLVPKAVAKMGGLNHMLQKNLTVPPGRGVGGRPLPAEGDVPGREFHTDHIGRVCDKWTLG